MKLSVTAAVPGGCWCLLLLAINGIAMGNVYGLIRTEMVALLMSLGK